MKQTTLNHLAQLLGISTSLMRKYEQKNLITFDRNEQTSYRHFSLNDVGKLMRIRQFRQAGFSLTQIEKMLNSQTVAEGIGEIEARQREIHAEIEERLRLLESLDGWKDNMRSIGQPEKLMDCPALRFREYIDDDGILNDRRLLHQARQWIDHMPHSFPCLLVNGEDTRQRKEECSYRVGIAMPEELACKDHITQNGAIILEAKTCMVITLPMVNGRLEWRSLFEKPLQEIERQSMRFEGDVWADVVFTGYRSDPDQSIMYWRFHFPVSSMKGE